MTNSPGNLTALMASPSNHAGIRFRNVSLKTPSPRKGLTFM
ncbi:MAG: hypothetical protein WC173_07015 [Bacteroidales bacterium]